MIRAAVAQASRRGWECLAVFPAPARSGQWVGALEQDGVALHFAAAGSRRTHAAWLGGLLRDRAMPTILHSHFTQFDVSSVIAARRGGRAAVLWHEHSPFSENPRIKARNLAKYIALGRLVDGILCVSPQIVEAVRRRGAPANRVEYFPNAIDTGRFRHAGEDDRAHARAALGLPPDRPVLMHFGWDWRRKGGDLFLEAAAALRKAGVNAVAATVNGGEPARADMRRLGLRESDVRILDASDDVRSLFAAADIFVSPSRAEGMTFAVIEALASGVPVVASDIPGHRIVGAELAACRLAPVDGPGFAEQMRDLLIRSPQQASTDREQACTFVRREFDLKPWSERLGARYDRALEAL
jgi:glycosyltransferase involved in cell wall biosynthesis